MYIPIVCTRHITVTLDRMEEHLSYCYGHCIVDCVVVWRRKRTLKSLVKTMLFSDKVCLYMYVL